VFYDDETPRTDDDAESDADFGDSFTNYDAAATE